MNRWRRSAVAAAVFSVVAGLGIPLAAVLSGLDSGVLNPLRHIRSPLAAPTRSAAVSVRSSPALVPAVRDLVAVLSVAPVGWSGGGTVLTGASLPGSVACVPATLAPVVTAYRTFTVGGREVDATLAAYAAGGGAPAFRTQFLGGGSCPVPRGSAVVTGGPDDGPGVARYSVSRYQAGVVTTTQVWRRGDVLAYLEGTDPTPVAGLAGQLDETLSHDMGGDCLNEDAPAGDSVRDPFLDRPSFQGRQVDEGIDGDPTPLPAVPAGVSPGPLGTAVPQVSPATLPSVPPWPVYPPLPSPVPVPVGPSAPASVSPTHLPLRERVPDPDGPGCGWRFTGMLPPLTPTLLTTGQIAAKQAVLRGKLPAVQAKWQVAVLTYWAAYTAFLGQVEGYETGYASQVAAVSADWDAIDAQWADYQQLQSAYDAMVGARQSFLDAQAKAASDYQLAQTGCIPATPDPAATVTPAAPPQPAVIAPSASPASPAQPGAPVTCSPPPEILAQSPPPAPTGPPPTTPADPRPPGARHP